MRALPINRKKSKAENRPQPAEHEHGGMKAVRLAVQAESTGRVVWVNGPARQSRGTRGGGATHTGSGAQTGLRG